jgi:hypothetical protein
MLAWTRTSVGCPAVQVSPCHDEMWLQVRAFTADDEEPARIAIAMYRASYLNIRDEAQSTQDFRSSRLLVGVPSAQAKSSPDNPVAPAAF